MAAKKKAAKKVRQKRLPGMADAKLDGLHSAALDYAEIRDQRQVLTKQEVELKGRLLQLMHRSKKDHYEYNGVTVDLVAEQETVKVKVRKAKADDDLPEEVSEAGEVEQEPEESELEEVEDFEGEEEAELAEVAEG